MSDHTYKTIEITGSSPKSIEAAVESALTRTGETVQNLRWFEVGSIRGHLVEGRIDHWQVTLKIGFAINPK
ncbi:MAG TPA: dodecin [Pseudomonadales bacterium]|jgi:flavin-binding protein dodecin|nr:dodecin [Pseudomonadales bacterium]